MPNPEEIMKYMCFGYKNEKWEQMSESEMNTLFDVCFAYDDDMRAKGHWLSGEAIESPSAAVSIRIKNGKVSVTDGPFIETKEQLGGVGIMEAKDLNEAIALWSKHPALGVSATGFEIRPIVDMTAIMDASRQRRKAAGKS
ncbi:MAG TPA: YciI family protein [Candidatus Acidoferrum sp.]